MFPNMRQYYDVKSGKYPTVEVNKEEFLEKCKAAGMPEAKAKSQLTICSIMGSNILIGNEMLKIKKEVKEEKKEE